MTEYTIDFEAWTTIEAEDKEDAMRIGQVLINTCVEVLAGADVTLEMVVRDNGIEEAS
jgi:hypothetical protein